jgi:hypothetical protein
MNISNRFAELTAGVREQAGPYAAKASDIARHFGARLLEQQTSMVKGIVHEGNERLRLFSKAANLSSALNEQFKYFAVTRERLARDASGTYAILTAAGRDAGKLAISGYQQLTGKAPKVLHAAAKPARKTARKSAAKATSRVKQTVKSRARKAAQRLCHRM